MLGRKKGPPKFWHGDEVALKNGYGDLYWAIGEVCDFNDDHSAYKVHWHIGPEVRDEIVLRDRLILVRKHVSIDYGDIY